MAKKRGVLLLFVGILLLTISVYGAENGWQIESKGLVTPTVVGEDVESEAELIMSKEDVERDVYARDLISEGESVKEEMEALGYSTSYIDDWLFEARRVMSKDFKTIDDYEFIREIVGKINKRYDDARFLKDELVMVKVYIDGLDRNEVNYSEVDARYDSVVKRFDRGQYEDLREDIDLIYKRAEEIMIEYSRTQAYLKASQRTLKNFVINNWLELILSLVVLSLLGMYVGDKILFVGLKRKLEMFKLEKKTINRLMKKAQQDHYMKGDISKGKYTIKMKHLKEREMQIMEEEPVMKIRVKKMKQNVFVRSYHKITKK